MNLFHMIYAAHEFLAKNKMVDFIAIDEIQMCADRERGHIFTERMLELRGSKLTMFLGSQVMENIIKELVDNVEFEKKDRFSKLSYTGIKKISRLDRKVAIIAFCKYLYFLTSTDSANVP